MNIIRQQIDFKMFPDFNHDFKEKLSKKAGVEIGFFYVISILFVFLQKYFLSIFSAAAAAAADDDDEHHHYYHYYH